MARTLKSKLDGLWSAVTVVHDLADEGYLDDDLKLVREIIENCEF